VRLSLRHDGRFAVTAAPLLPLRLLYSASHPASNAVQVALIMAERRLPDANPLSAHKTTLRQHYDEGVQAAERAGAFDSLFFTHDGRLVEGGRSSVFVRLDGRWWTPPLRDGALPGVMRALVLEDPSWQAGERSLYLADLQRAEAVMVCNALRGTLMGHLR
jgi:para-aminobenzoate synthetase/4-amino-4-deoxychorismate lyase